MSEAQIERKISARVVIGNVKKYIPEKEGQTVGLFMVYGQANRTRRGDSDYGPWVALVGRFEAVPMVGENAGLVISAPQCFLPPPMDELLAGQIEGDGATESVQFALEIGIKSVAKAATGYEYVAKPVVDVEAADPLADLRGKLSLPAPPKSK